MGFLVCHAKYFIDQCKKNNINGEIITFGRFDFFLHLDEFYALMIEAGYASIEGVRVVFKDPVTESIMEDMRREGRHLNKNFNYPFIVKPPVVSDEFVYAGLGFRTFHFLDISARDGELSFVFNLNDENVLDVTGRTYDLVLDAGTAEHIFDTRQVLLNMTDLVKEGGFAIHILPGNNAYDHGFYQFCPTLYRDYYKANNYEICNISVLALIKDVYHKPDVTFTERWDSFRIWEYDQIEFCRNSFGGLGEGVYFTCVCVKKTAASKRDQVPTQYLFQQTQRQLKHPWF